MEACMGERPFDVGFHRTTESKQAAIDQDLAALSTDQLLRLLWKIETVIRSKAAELFRRPIIAPFASMM
jgi:hypothetical protein